LAVALCKNKTAAPSFFEEKKKHRNPPFVKEESDVSSAALFRPS